MLGSLRNRLLEVLVGLLFGIGLLLSGMTDPGKVQAFLDLAGPWDPSLAFVMGGAIAVSIGAFAIAKRRAQAFFGATLHLPAHQTIDRRLILGGALFGIGWGLAGFCPGPGLVSLAAGEMKAAIFVAAMVAGMLIFSGTERLRQRATPDPATPSPQQESPMSFTRLSPDFAVAGQISIEDVAAIAQAGFKSIVCNRPDDEDPGQPKFDSIAHAARSVGLQIRHLPAPSGQVTPEHGMALAQLLSELPGPVLAYCRSGARSQSMWSLARATPSA